MATKYNYSVHLQIIIGPFKNHLAFFGHILPPPHIPNNLNSINRTYVLLKMFSVAREINIGLKGKGTQHWRLCSLGDHAWIFELNRHFPAKPFQIFKMLQVQYFNIIMNM